MRALHSPHIVFRFESPDILARVIPDKPGDWQRSIGSAGVWDDAHIPRTAVPVRFCIPQNHRYYGFSGWGTFIVRRIAR